MPLPLLATSVLAFLAVGYLAYGRFVARRLRLDPGAVTPAVAHADGRDYVPTRPFYLLGQHFSAIAAAGPIVGPIAACLLFGWLPCVLWIALGAVLVGAVHDLTALVASVRHGGRSIAELARQHLGRRAWLTLVGFVWIALVYVIVAFTDVTVETFLGKTEELEALAAPFNKGGAVALAAVTYLLLAMTMGLVQRALRPPLWLLTAVFVPATLGAIWLGTEASTWVVLDRTTWRVAILAYCFVASLLPCWLLLQPRGYLGGFVLYLALAAGVLGMFFGGYAVEQPAFRGFVDAKTGLTLFPFLFVTIACGACSGFHGLVCGGTTSKQVSNEVHCRPVGYGAMLLEAFVALVALATIVTLPVASGTPGVVYGEGIARFLTDVLALGPHAALVALTFGLMAFSTFVFDTLDVGTRLGRYLLQELTGRRGRLAAVVATALTAGVPLAVVLSGEEGGWRKFWLLFGSSNQLLAAMTLLAASVWLRRVGRPVWFTLAPALFVLAITVWALGKHVVDGWDALRSKGFDVTALNGVVAAVLLVLAASFAGEVGRAWRRPAPPRETAPAPAA
jgi:carbon starvation protein